MTFIGGHSRRPLAQFSDGEKTLETIGSVTYGLGEGHTKDEYQGNFDDIDTEDCTNYRAQKQIAFEENDV